MDPKRTKTNKTYITIQDHDGADTTQDGVKRASYHILRSFQLPPSLTQHLPNKSSPLLYYEVVLAATNRCLPSARVTDIVCFRRCRVPIDYFATTGPSAANETHPTSVHTSAMTLVLCKRVRIIHFMAITRKFAPTRDGLFTSTMHLTLNSCQFFYFFCNSTA